MDGRLELSTNSPPSASLFGHNLKIAQSIDLQMEFSVKKLPTVPTTTTKLLLKTEQQV
jgi:hypothetical protein